MSICQVNISVPDWALCFSRIQDEVRHQAKATASSRVITLSYNDDMGQLLPSAHDLISFLNITQICHDIQQTSDGKRNDYEQLHISKRYSIEATGIIRIAATQWIEGIDDQLDLKSLSALLLENEEKEVIRRLRSCAHQCAMDMPALVNSTAPDADRLFSMGILGQDLSLIRQLATTERVNMLHGGLMYFERALFHAVHASDAPLCGFLLSAGARTDLPCTSLIKTTIAQYAMENTEDLSITIKDLIRTAQTREMAQFAIDELKYTAIRAVL